MSMKNRSGTTLTELLVVLVIMGVIGAAMTGLLVSQSRFFNDQEGQANARRVARGGTTLLMSDLRAVETTNGIVSANPTDFVIRVPYWMGVVCGANGSNLVVTLQPIDSLILAKVAHTGWSWVDSLGVIHYQYGAAAPNSYGGSSVCGPLTPGKVSAIPGGKIMAFGITPAGANPGTPILLYHRIHYYLGNSVTVPGRRGLFRRLQSGGPTEELVAPFDTTAGFRYHMRNGSIAANPATMSDVVGIEFTLTGLNERNVTGGRTERAPLTTSVFFENR